MNAAGAISRRLAVTLALGGALAAVGVLLFGPSQRSPQTTRNEPRPAPAPAPPAAPAPAHPPQGRPKLYWFIPDGMRADPELFNVFRWAAEGKMPNLQRMLQRGAYGFCKPTFPSHTPANFATLFTGAYPEIHGVNDGPMRATGAPLAQVSVSGFSSVAKKVEPIWVTLERLLGANVALLSVPGSTPPELKHGFTIHGRWGRWGADFPAINFHDRDDPALRALDPSAGRLFYTGPQLTQRLLKTPARDWTAIPRSYSPALECALSAWGATVHAGLCDSTDDGVTNYDRVAFSVDKRSVLCTLQPGAWSDWLPITLRWQLPGQTLEQEVRTQFRAKLIRLQADGTFRIRLFYNNLNRHLADPPRLAEELISGVGPMVDFVDNFPPQLILFPEDKTTFLEEAGFSLDWHRDAATFVLTKYQPDILINDIYTPNQMLTSRWWMGHVDPASARYNQVSEPERARLWQEIHWLYGKLDEILGRLLQAADANTYVVLSSDHGAIPWDVQVRLNNLFAREGLLKFQIDPQTGERRIDWAQTKAVYLQMHNIYLNPDGLAGNWTRPSGPAYEQLRQRVRELLLGLQDERGVRPVEKLLGWEQAQSQFRLHSERTGDLVLANRAGYGWSEEMTEDHAVFGTPPVSGYKQAILPEKVRGLWTPFVIIGPGIKPGHFLGERPIEMVDQHPTLLRCLGQKPPAWVQGRVLNEVFAQP